MATILDEVKEDLGKVKADKATMEDAKVKKEKDDGFTVTFLEYAPNPLVLFLRDFKVLPSLVRRCLESSLKTRFPDEAVALDEIVKFVDADPELMLNMSNMYGTTAREIYLDSCYSDTEKRSVLKTFFTECLWVGFDFNIAPPPPQPRRPAAAPRARRRRARQPTGALGIVTIHAQCDSSSLYKVWERYMGYMDIEASLSEFEDWLGCPVDELDRDLVEAVSDFITDRASESLCEGGISDVLDYDEQLDRDYYEHLEDDMSSLRIDDMLTNAEELLTEWGVEF